MVGPGSGKAFSPWNEFGFEFVAIVTDLSIFILSVVREGHPGPQVRVTEAGVECWLPSHLDFTWNRPLWEGGLSAQL